MNSKLCVLAMMRGDFKTSYILKKLNNFLTSQIINENTHTHLKFL